MRIHTRDFLSSLVVLAFGLGAYVMAMRYGDAGIVPRLVSGIMVFAAILMLIRSVLRPPAMADSADETVSSDFRRLTPEEAVRTTIAIVLTLFFILLVKPLGFFTAAFLYIPLSAYALGLRNHVAIWLGTILFLGFSYYLFRIAFQTPLPSESILQFL
jgi:hypothetical protein